MNHPKQLPSHHITEYSETEIQNKSYSKDTCAYYHTLNSPQFGQTLSMHSHSFYELNFIVKGCGMHYLANNIIPVCAGSFFMIPPHTRHGYWSEDTFSIFHILLSSKFLCEHQIVLQKQSGYFSLFDIQPLLQHQLNHTFFPKLKSDYFTYMATIAERLCTIYNSEPENISTLGIQLVLSFLLELEAYISNHTKASGFQKNDAYSQILSAMEYIMLHFSQNLRFEEISKRFNMSYSTFYRNFLKVTSVPPSDFLTNYRIKYAGNMILYTNLSMTEIAQNCGFYDSAHLTKSFIRAKHMTPSQYRKFHLERLQKRGCSL